MEAPSATACALAQRWPPIRGWNRSNRCRHSACWAPASTARIRSMPCSRWPTGTWANCMRWRPERVTCRRRRQRRRMRPSRPARPGGRCRAISSTATALAGNPRHRSRGDHRRDRWQRHRHRRDRAAGAPAGLARVLASEAARGACSSFTLAQALQFAIDARVQVLNLSLTGPSDRLLARLLDVALARDVSVVGAVDASAPDGGFPASHPGVLAVDGLTHVAAIASVRAPADGIPATRADGGWGLVSGTSFAAAQVSGLMALLRGKPRAWALRAGHGHGTRQDGTLGHGAAPGDRRLRGQERVAGHASARARPPRSRGDVAPVRMRGARGCRVRWHC